MALALAPQIGTVETDIKSIEGVEDVTAARILVVDDSTTMRAIVGGCLRNRGFRNIVFAANGLEGLRVALETPPDLVITDLMMPEMDGFELCRQLRNRPETENIPILVQTGMEEASERTKVFAAGASDLVTKPLDPSELIGRVRVHLDRQKLIKRLSDYQAMMAQEFEQARVMQETLLPGDAELGELRKRYPIELASLYRASIGLGGDIWGIHPLGTSRIRIFSADFTGHGLSSALNTFRLHSCIQTAPTDLVDPAQWCQFLNGFLCKVLPTGQFATMFAAVIDFETECMTYCGGGSPPVLLQEGVDSPYRLIDCTGFPLGLTRRASYSSETVPFGPGAELMMYSDALIETPDPPHSIFTPESLCDFLNESRLTRQPQAVLDKVLTRLNAKGAVTLSDDLTMVALRRRQIGSAA